MRSTLLSLSLALLLAGYGFGRVTQEQAPEPSSSATAQPQDQSNPAPSGPGQPQGTAPEPRRGHGRHGGWGGRQDPAKRVQRLTKKLHLSAEQQSKIRSILEGQQTQAQAIRQDTSLSQQDRRGKMMQLRKDTHEQVRAALNPEQRQKFDAMAQKHAQKIRSRRPQDSNAEPAPSPQQ